MLTLLQIDSSIFGAEGQSTRLATGFSRQWLEKNPDGRVIKRSLVESPVPHLDPGRFQSLITPEEDRTPDQQAVHAYSMTLIEELRQADVLVLGVPMYNFSIPSSLHAYFDHIARSGITFRYTASGPEGFLQGKKAYVFITRGGVYGQDHTQTEYLRQFLAFIGITDVEFVHAEGLNMPELREASLAKAEEARNALLAA